MMTFPIQELMDEQKCYDYLLKVLHPHGLTCPVGHSLRPGQNPHDRHRAPVLDYRCPACGRVFNAFTQTVWSGGRYTCVQMVLIVRGIAQGVPTEHLADELGIDRSHLLAKRHEIQQLLEQRLPPSPLTDEVVEADEMYQNAGEKGQKHDNPADPPRRRANDVKGHGTWDNDRPPIAEVIGRESGQVRLQVCHHSDRKTLVPFVVAQTAPDCTVNTDEWQAYNTLPDTGRTHVQVCHSFGPGEWARDDDGDGIREVHTTAIEGFWTGLRNFLRPFRGVNKEHLSHYIAVHEWASNVKQVTNDFLRAMM